MGSAGTRTVTVVTLITLLLAPVLGKDGEPKGHRVVERTRTVETVKCNPGEACPAKRTTIRKVFLSREATKRLARRQRAYTVRRGDTLYSLADRFGVSVKQLQALNGIRSSNRIRAGSTIWIPVLDARGSS